MRSGCAAGRCAPAHAAAGPRTAGGWAAGQRVDEGALLQFRIGALQLRVGVLQRGGQLRGAALHAGVQGRGEQGQAQQQLTEASITISPSCRAAQLVGAQAHRALGYIGGGHAGVVHAADLVGRTGVEPVTNGLKVRCSTN
jgi:hypothetical protein